MSGLGFDLGLCEPGLGLCEPGLGSKLENKKMQPFMFVAVIISYSIFTVYCSLWTKYNRRVVKYFHAMLD